MTAETASQREQRKWEKQEQKEKNFSIISNGALNIFFFLKSQMRCIVCCYNWCLAEALIFFWVTANIQSPQMVHYPHSLTDATLTIKCHVV